MIKPGDVFRFQYSPEEEARITRAWYPGHSRHCFDGQLVACSGSDGLRLVDTYWHWPTEPGWGSNGREFTPEDALARGTLTFICNLDDVEDTRESSGEFYAPEDFINLSYQHGCYKRFVLRKGAKRSQARMREVAQQKIDKARHDAEWAKRTEERLTEMAAKIEAGDLDSVWF